MPIEIELKFSVTPLFVEQLPVFIQRFPVVTSSTQTLFNQYFDTKEGLLRQHHFGLRIRGVNGQYEMTLKGKGDELGGLFQRSEVNVPITQPELEISAFPAECWQPLPLSAQELQQQLEPAFKTDFQRTTWEVEFQQSVVEIALDQGEIATSNHSSPIYEVELELKQGTLVDLLDMADQLTSIGGACLNAQSKAARGYQLLNGNVSEFLTLPECYQLNKKATIDTAITALFTEGLSRWQRCEERWLAGDLSAKERLIDVLFTVRQLWRLLGRYIPRKASASLREPLIAIEGQLSLADNAKEICYSADYQKIKLALIRWVYLASWREGLSTEEGARLKQPFKHYAIDRLNKYAAELRKTFSVNMTEEAYTQQQTFLQRTLALFRLLSGEFTEQSVPYLSAWQALYYAIRDKKPKSTLETLRLKALVQKRYWLS